MFPQESMYDLIVIGGGPAGTSAAITAARSGARVLLLERGRFPRHKVCGEFVSAESLDLLAALLDSRHAPLLHQAVAIPRARLYLDGRVLETAVDPPAASIARLDLDAALWHSAESAGVDARQQVHVQGVVQSRPETGPFRILTATGDFEARALVNASGRWSNLNASPPPQGTVHEKWLGLKAHFAEPSPEASVDLYFFDGGYCGVQPVDVNSENSDSENSNGRSSNSQQDSQPAGRRLENRRPQNHRPQNHGRVNACAMVRREVGSTLTQVFARHPALRERSRRWRLLSDPVGTSPLIFRDPQPQRDGVLMAGDAAGFVDPFVGDGISLALRSGSLAAQCLTPFLTGELPLQDAAQQYRQIYEQRLDPVFRASSRIRRMLVLPRVLRTPLLLLLEKTPAITRYVVSKTR
jgi:flavin-dependent dehydrogenase